MKNFKTKSVITVVTFIIGISVVYLSHNFLSFVILDISNSHTANANLSQKSASTQAKKVSDKLEIRFIEFVQGEREVEAKFELTNNSEENVYYYSYSKDSHPSPILRRSNKVVTDRRAHCTSGFKEQNLAPGEAVFYRVWKSQATYEPTKNFWRTSDKPTQLGFPITMGDERRKEILWTEEIKFPE